MSEIFKLDDGSEVGTGLNSPDAQEILLMADVREYPDDLILEPKEIERRLVINGAQRYIEDRKRRQFRVRNQGSLGKCNGSSNASGLEQVREVQGMPHVAISDCYIYSLVNGGRDRGSGLITTFRQMQEKGAAPYHIQLGGVTKTLSNTFYNRSQVSPDLIRQADIEAKRFLGWEFYKAPTGRFEDYCKTIASALARKNPVVFAWHVGSGGMRLRGGYAQVGRGPGNHSNLLHSAKWVGGKTLVHPDDMNSWGPCEDSLYGKKGGSGWGEKGFGLFTMEDVYACASNHCTYIMTAARVDPNDPAFG